MSTAGETSLRGRALRCMAVAIGLALTFGVLASSASAATHKVRVHRMFMPAPPAPGTPESFRYHGKNLDLNQVGVIEVGPKTATNVLVLEPGTSAAAAYFVPFAKWLVERVPGWQVWAVERRENLLEDQSMLNKAKAGKANAEEVFNYYLGWLVNPAAVPHHFKAVPEASVGFAREWGMNVAVEDLHVVVEAAKALGGKVVLGGHSLGGSVVTAYATWDFNGSPGADGLSGLVYDDGGSSPTAISAEEAEKELKALSEKSPWLAFGGIPSPYLGLFSALGSTATIEFPEEASLAETFPLLPADLVPKGPEGEILPVTNEAEFGYGVNYKTSPEALIAAQVHAGQGLEEKPKEDGLYGWNGEGALTPLRRYAEMLSGTGIHNANGTEWYFPERLTIDTGAVADGNANPAQEVLDEHAIFGHELPKSLKILAIDTELDKLLGSGNTLQAAEILAEQSEIPKENLTLINEEETYSHNDPAGAYPNNEFFNKLVPYLEGL
jgi:pimeloyl-ACP methyl ester carboxylesterase